MPPDFVKEWLPLAGWLVSAGFATWILRARRLTVYEDLDKRYVKADDAKRDLGGIRKAVREELNDMGARVDASTAQAALAVKMADGAIDKAQETAYALEMVHKRDLQRLEETLKVHGEQITAMMHQSIKQTGILQSILDNMPRPPLPPTKAD